MATTIASNELIERYCTLVYWPLMHSGLAILAALLVVSVVGPADAGREDGDEILVDFTNQKLLVNDEARTGDDVDAFFESLATETGGDRIAIGSSSAAPIALDDVTLEVVGPVPDLRVTRCRRADAPIGSWRTAFAVGSDVAPRHAHL